MKMIYLIRDLYALVDDEDYDFLMQWKWSAGVHDQIIYATRKAKRNDVDFIYRSHIGMHQVIMNSFDMLVDHADGNGLNNQRYNLRVCTHPQNMRNSKTPKNNKSGYKGVFFYQKKIGLSRIMLE